MQHIEIHIKFFCLVFIFLPLFASAQKKFEWAKNIGGESNDYANAIKVAASGDIYITGSFSGTAMFDSIQLKSSGKADAFIAKYNSMGTLQWVEQIKGKGNDIGLSITVDDIGNAYVTGTFEEKAHFDTVSVNSKGRSDFFIAQYSASGIFQWVKTGGGTDDDEANSITMDNFNNIYITGSFQSKANIDTIFFTSDGYRDIYLSKLDSLGNVKWVKTIDGKGAETGYGISVDRKQQVYITGFFSDTITFSGKKIGSKGNKDIYIAKYSPEGEPLWLRQAGGKQEDVAYAIANDRWNNSYITGSFRKNATFGDTTIGSAGSTDIFIAKYDSTGNFRWVQKGGGLQSEEANAIAVDGNGNAYITGKFEGAPKIGEVILRNREFAGIFVAQCDASGKIKWAYHAGRTSQDAGNGIDLNLFGSPFITGVFKENADFEKTTLLNNKSGSCDMFIAKVLPPDIIPKMCDTCDQVLKAGFINFFPSSWFFSYEKALTSNTSFQISAGGWSNATGQQSKYKPGRALSPNGLDDLPVSSMYNLKHRSIIAAYRNYPFNRATDGFYYSCQVKLDHGINKFSDFYTDSIAVKYDFIRNNIDIGAGLNIGYQLVSNRRYCLVIDLHLGFEIHHTFSSPRRFYDKQAEEKGFFDKYPYFDEGPPYFSFIRPLLGVSIGKAF